MKKCKLRNIGKMLSVNDGTRSLNESIMSNEVIDTLNDLIKNNENTCVLIGGIALSFYIKPKYTQDVYVLFLSHNDIPDSVYQFKRHRKGTFQNNKSHVEVEVITPEIINISGETVQAVIASPSGIVALKLGRFNLRDMADIYEYDNILKHKIIKRNINIFKC